MLFRNPRTPDDAGGGGTPAPDPTLNLKSELGRKTEALEALKAQNAELVRFKEEQEAAAARAREADLAAKGNFETLAAEKDARIAALEARTAEFEKAEKARAAEVAAKLDEVVAKRTDADAMRGKLIRLVGDDPHKQWDLYQELAGSAATVTTAPPTQTPATDGGGGNGLPSLTTEELDKCRVLAPMMNRTFEDQCKWLQAQKANLPANPWESQNAAEAARQGVK